MVLLHLRSYDGALFIHSLQQLTRQTMVISSNALAYIDVIHKYLALLAAGDVRAIVALFGPQGVVHSPFLGVKPAGEFFDLLKAATRRSVLEDAEVFVSAAGSRRASVCFTYLWERTARR
jgi:hypothetical protein